MGSGNKRCSQGIARGSAGPVDRDHAHTQGSLSQELWCFFRMLKNQRLWSHLSLVLGNHMKDPVCFREH